MTRGQTWHRWVGDDLELSLHVQPRAAMDGFAGEHGARLKVRLTAPPADGKANAALVAFLAHSFGVPKSSVVVVAGQSSREKRVRIRQPTQIPASLPVKSPRRQ